MEKKERKVNYFILISPPCCVIFLWKIMQSNENENYENEINLNGIIMEEEIMKGLENNSSLQTKNNIV
jgi:hypothetical protein